MREQQIATRSVTATAPARIDLAGGWTDVPPYTTEVGGAVCNVAVELRATAVVRATTRHTPRMTDPLVDAAWRAAGEPDACVQLASSFPVGSGLGGSSAAGVALAAALAAWQHEYAAGDAATGAHTLDPQVLAERSRRTETEVLGVPGGCQDHYAAAFGGALLLQCGHATSVTQVPLSEMLIDAFERRVVIAYTGESRMSSRTITAVLDAWRAGERTTCDALREMAALAPRMADALRTGALDTLGALVSEQWQAQRALHPTITTARIDAIVADAANAGALGTKALGASGGGCVVVIARAEAVDAVRASVARHAELLPFAIARTGVQVTWSDT